ncbi:MAG TPA: hypothetical protein VKD22_11560, partial [Ramlibacter sp.]|nr:hypothetical protein [Ramlibacter sp.]
PMGTALVPLAAGGSFVLFAIMYYATFLPTMRIFFPEDTLFPFGATILLLMSFIAFSVHMSKTSLVERLAFIFPNETFTRE